ncbi:thiamine phosphate synthase [Frateuria aurantia]
MITLPRFYPLTASAAGVALLAGAGARLIQLRIKSCEPSVLRTEIQAAQVACRRHGATLVLNDYWTLAIELGVGWVHLGQEDLARADWRACRRHGLKLGLSTHDEAELEHALAHAPDYLALGPIWPSRLKPMHWAAQGTETIGRWRQRIGALPLVAIGGVTLERAVSCLRAGADAVAVSTDIAAATDPAARVGLWLRQLTRARPR